MVSNRTLFPSTFGTNMKYVGKINNVYTMPTQGNTREWLCLKATGIYSINISDIATPPLQAMLHESLPPVTFDIR